MRCMKDAFNLYFSLKSCKALCGYFHAIIKCDENALSMFAYLIRRI